MKIMFLLFLFCAMACLPGLATAQNATYNYARGVDFSFYWTYQWVDIEGAAAPQLYLAYQMSFRLEKQIGQYIRGGARGHGPGWDYGCIYGAIYSGPTMSVESNSTIQFGNLVLDIYDSAFKELVWRGNVSKATNPEQKGYNLNKGVAKLLKNFPRKAKN